VLADDDRMVGVVTRRDMLDAALRPRRGVVEDLAIGQPAVLHPDLTLREAANAMETVASRGSPWLPATVATPCSVWSRSSTC
jgi:chloride channel protein, CIC family